MNVLYKSGYHTHSHLKFFKNDIFMEVLEILCRDSMRPILTLQYDLAHMSSFTRLHSLYTSRYKCYISN